MTAQSMEEECSALIGADTVDAFHTSVESQELPLFEFSFFLFHFLSLFPLVTVEPTVEPWTVVLIVKGIFALPFTVTGVLLIPSSLFPKDIDALVVP